MKNKWITVALLFLLATLHLPFMSADPDQLVDWTSRGAWTDEGLYSAQTRNLLNYGDLGYNDHPTFVICPLLTAIHAPFMWVFGQNRLVLRSITLCVFLITLLLAAKWGGLHTVIPAFIALGATQYQVFHFSHYAMAELICISFILVGLIMLLNYLKTLKSKWLWLCSLFMFLAYLTKVQFIYVAAIPVLTLFFLGWVQNKKEFIRYGLHASIIAFVFGIGYFLCWYLPNSDLINHVLLRAVGQASQSTVFDGVMERIKFNINIYLWTKTKFHLILLFGVSIVVFIFRKKHYSTPLITTSAFSIVWLVIELYKVPMNYFPERYFLGGVVALTLFTTCVLTEFSINTRFRSFTLALLAIIFIYHSSMIYSSYKRRTDQLNRVNNYLKQYALKDVNIIGSAWSSSITWGTAARTYPVWKNYFNYDNPIERLNPKIIITEGDEKKRQTIFKNSDVNLNAITDSVRSFPVWKFKVNVHWIKELNSSQSL